MGPCLGQGRARQRCWCYRQGRVQGLLQGLLQGGVQGLLQGVKDGHVYWGQSEGATLYAVCYVLYLVHVCSAAPYTRCRLVWSPYPLMSAYKTESRKWLITGRYIW